MKIVLVLCLLFPSICGSADYTRSVSAESIIENRGGQVLLKSRSGLSKRIERFSIAHGADPKIAPELAELLAACEHPRVLAAVAAKESRFNPNAVGKSGEIGAWQVIPKHWGHPGRSLRSQAKKSEAILKELVDASGGKLEVAVRKYNGSGPKAVRYASHVMSMARSI